MLGHTELMLKLARDGEGEEGRVSCVAAASRIHRLSHLKCILTGSGTFSILTWKAGDTPVDIPRGKARAKG